MFPNLLTSAISALAPIAGTEAVQYRYRAPNTWAAGEPVAATWSAWTDVPRPYVVDNVETARTVPAPDGNVAAGALVVFAGPLPGVPGPGDGPEAAAAGVPAGSGDVLGAPVQFRVKGRDWACTAASAWDSRAGFLRYVLSPLNR